MTAYKQYKETSNISVLQLNCGSESNSCPEKTWGGNSMAGLAPFPMGPVTSIKRGSRCKL